MLVFSDGVDCEISVSSGSVVTTFVDTFSVDIRVPEYV